jgi:zona occludens toxin
MAITVYTGVPGAGKSYGMIEQALLPAMEKGRRVLTNIGGVDPDKVHDYCAKKWPEADLGEVVLFTGEQSLKPGFWPTEATGDADTFVRGGDLVIFDEWKLTYPSRGKLPSDDLEPFLRWHRHLTDAKGVACDVIIGTQLLTDIHRDFRGLVERSYKFRKLKAVGLKKAFAWDAYEGHLQPKGTAFRTGNGTYKPEVFALYQSYATDGDGQELATDKRTNIWTKGVFVMMAGTVLMVGLGCWGAYRFFVPDNAPKEAVQIQPGTMPVGQVAPGAVGMDTTPGRTSRPKSPYRIVGHVDSGAGVKIVLSDDKGSVRVVGPSGFDFEAGRPVYGILDGQAVVADDRIQLPAVSRSGFGVTL